MSSIPIGQARAQFTSDCIDVFISQLPATSFLRSFFPSEQAFVRYLSIQVERNYENVAVDVMRGTEGNRNNFSKSTEKVLDPPLYEEYFDMTEIDLYDRLFGSTSITDGVYTQLVQTVARRLNQIREKIERAIEIQCAQVLQVGTTTLVNQTSINWQRKAASLVANAAGNTWATNTINPFDTLAAGATFLRTVGKSGDTTFNAILGSQALSDLYGNTLFKERVTQNLNNSIDVINAPQRNATGAAYHGQLTAGSWRINLWSYPQFYDVAGTSTPYIDPKKVVMIPTTPRFKLGFAAVPQLLIGFNGGTNSDINMAPIAAQPFVVDHYPDVMNTAHKMRIKSAALAIPVAIDQIYTVQPVA